MIQKIGKYIRQHAFKIMISGMIIAISGVLMLVFIRLGKITIPKNYALFIGILGLSVYLIGRIAHFLNMKGSKNNNDTTR